MNEQKFPTKAAANRVVLNDIQEAADIDRCYVYHDPVGNCLAVKCVLILVKNKPNQPSMSAALRKKSLIKWQNAKAHFGRPFSEVGMISANKFRLRRRSLNF